MVLPSGHCPNGLCIFWCFLLFDTVSREEQDSIRKAALSVERQSVPSITEGLKESSDVTIQEQLTSVTILPEKRARELLFPYPEALRDGCRF